MRSRAPLGPGLHEVEDLRIGRLVAPPAQQRDEVGDARHRLAQVVSHHVGVGAQLGLRAPVRGHVGHEDDEPVAELGHAPRERPLDATLAEGDVEGQLVGVGLARVAHARVGGELAAAHHLGQHAQQRGVRVQRRLQGEEPHDLGVAVADAEVLDDAVGAAHRPQQAHRVGQPVEHRAQRGGARRTQQRVERRILPPRFRLRIGHAPR
jgi:hypothetical protein